ncbi:hypothetical protein JVU11DRAFT_7642 [Chiua virens]|nr:hypothetical protein JVU11DRAFT_7642 [Chiua virens]
MAFRTIRVNLALKIGNWFKENKKKLAGWIRGVFEEKLEENGNAHGETSDPDQTENNLNDRPPLDEEENQILNDIAIAVTGPTDSGKSTNDAPNTVDPGVEAEESVGKRTPEDLKLEHQKEMIDQGSQVVRCRNDEVSTGKPDREILEKEDGCRVPFQDGPGSTAEVDEATIEQQPILSTGEVVQEVYVIRRMENAG